MGFRFRLVKVCFVVGFVFGFLVLFCDRFGLVKICFVVGFVFGFFVMFCFVC